MKAIVFLPTKSMSISLRLQDQGTKESVTETRICDSTLRNVLRWKYGPIPQLGTDLDMNMSRVSELSAAAAVGRGNVAVQREESPRSSDVVYIAT